MAPRRSARNKTNTETSVAVEEKVIKPKEKATKKKQPKNTETVEEDVETATNGKQNKVAEEDMDATPHGEEKVSKKKSATQGKGTSAQKQNDEKITKKKSHKSAEGDDLADEDETPTKKSKTEDVAAETDQDLAQTIYSFKANNIKGEEVSLENYKGHVCIIINVASKCGRTKSNYEQLVELDEKYSESKGLKILAFPCNQFGEQEPGDAQKICEFVEKRNVKFDMFDKIDVNGKNAHPLWAFLQSKIAGPKGNKIDWNFTKFVINKEGEVVERFKSSVKPLDMVETLEKYW